MPMHDLTDVAQHKFSASVLAASMLVAAAVAAAVVASLFLLATPPKDGDKCSERGARTENSQGLRLLCTSDYEHEPPTWHQCAPGSVCRLEPSAVG